MKISSKDGTIHFAKGIVSRDLSLPQFIGSSLGRSAKETISNTDRRHYEFDPETGISATVFFQGEALDRVLLMMSMPSDSAKIWTEELELQRKAVHDNWLESELGEPPHEYGWGRVVSDYDARGCVSEIIVVYER